MPFGVYGGQGSLTSKFDTQMTKSANKAHDSLKQKKEQLKKGFKKLINGSDAALERAFIKGIFERVDTGDIFEFQFNPESIAESHSVNYAVTSPIQSEQPLYQHINKGERSVTFSLFLNGLEPPDGHSYTSKTPIGGKYIDGKFGALSRPIRHAVDGATGFAAKKIPFAEGVGTALGHLNRFFGKEVAKQPTKPTRNILQDMEVLDSYMQGSGNGPPPILNFDFPRFYQSQWIMTNITYTTNMWDWDGNPLHVTAALTLKEVFREIRKKENKTRVGGI